ncbi:MAG TPA: hypothetical protein VNJ28_06315 [Candidatus Limnocylindrales bacterium]|nr:hypothetical protein [Candidatus Limnocylindrales bacterium]
MVGFVAGLLLGAWLVSDSGPLGPPTGVGFAALVLPVATALAGIPLGRRLAVWILIGGE